MYVQVTSCVYGDGMPEQEDMAPMAPVSIFSLNLKENQLRSSHQTCFMKRVVLRNFAKFTGKHLCQSPFFNKVVGLGPATLLKKRLWHRCFPVNFVKFLRSPFYIEHLWWLLLHSPIYSVNNILNCPWIIPYSSTSCHH